MTKEFAITNNKRNYQFEALLTDGAMAWLQYRWLKGAMVLMQTFVPATHRGMGVGEALVTHVLEHARSHGLKVKVYCHFASAYIKDHPEWNDVLEA